MSEDHVEISDLDDDQRAHLARAVEEYDVAQRDSNPATVSLGDDPKAVAERVRHGDDAVTLRRGPDDVDEVQYVLQALDYQLERIDEGKPDKDEDYERSRSKREAMTDRAHLYEVIREQAESQGVAYDENEVRDATESR